MSDHEYENEVQSNITDNRTLSVITKAEIDMQITTAKAYPRSISKFISECKDLVMLSEDIAKECMYVLTRKDRDGRKTIEGPSSRLGEIVMSCWGNCRGGARIVAEERDFVVAQGIFHDLERNVNVTYEVKRRITTSDGRRYGVDMIGVTGNAACSIALRNAIFKGVPKAFWQGIYETAKSTALGNEQTIKGRREKALAYWKSQGISEEKVFKYLGVSGADDIGLPELMTLIGLVTAIKEGDTTVEQAFSDPDLQPGQTKETKDLNDALKKNPDGSDKLVLRNAYTPIPGEVSTITVSTPLVVEDFDLEQPQTPFTMVDVKAKIKDIEAKAKKAKTAAQKQEVQDLVDETADMLSALMLPAAERDALTKTLSGFVS